MAGMAHNAENSVTTGKRRNSTVYVAKTATGDNNTDLLRYGIHNERSAGETVANVAKGELPRRDSVLQIKTAFEKVVKKTGSRSGKLRESLTNSKVVDVDKISTAREINSRCVQGNHPSALESHSVKSAYNKSQISCDSVKSQAGCVAEEHTALGLAADPSAQQPDSKPFLRGSLLMQPASNIRGSLAKAEYLGLNKFNDVKTYSCSKKRPKMTVDELDKRLEASSPAADHANIDDTIDESCGYEEEPLQSQELDNDLFACEFVGAGVKGNRPVLKSSKSTVNKKVSFCLGSTSVFEYPAEPVEIVSSPPPSSEPNASEYNSTHDDESESDGDQLNLSSKTSLQSSPGCSATGKLGSYQSRILEHCDLSPCYNSPQPPSSTPSLPAQQQQQQYFETKDLRQRVNKAQPLFATSCSADDQPSRPWSDIHGNGKSGSELLY